MASTGQQRARNHDLSVRSSGAIDSNGDAIPPAPILTHRMKHDKSILALAVSATTIFAGTQGGEILVYSLDTYERRRVLEAHRGSVLGLCLSQDQTLLFSSATDPIVNVWSTSTFLRLYSLWSTYDVGDIFCVAYSSYHRTVYLGAQNTSIQVLHPRSHLQTCANHVRSGTT